MKLFSLIGYPLSHSFSPRYFRQKFRRLGLEDYRYTLREMEKLDGLRDWVEATPELAGFNVTIPHKEAILPLLDEVSEEARRIGAVNTVRLEKGRLRGFNTDYYGFRESLLHWLPMQNKPEKALILGSGGASKAVRAVFRELGFPFRIVSRSAERGDLTYAELHASHLKEFRLLINTTPLGMAPEVDRCPQLPYSALGAEHWLYDLVYNPAHTLFMQQGARQGAQVKNGEEMLILQAERAWEIWEK